jgi:hypothetical protein
VDESSTLNIYELHAVVILKQRRGMSDQEFREDNGGEINVRPLFGIYRCLYCGRCFAIKRQLKLHYQEAHIGSMLDYGGKMTGSLLRIANRSKEI